MTSRHQPPPPLLHLILARSKHTNLSIRSTTLRRILSWIPPPLSVDPVHLRRSLWEISTTCLVHQQGTSLFFCINHRIEFDAVASSLFLVEHCFQRPFVFCRYRNFVGLLRAKFAHQKEQGHFFSPAWTEDPGLSPRLFPSSVLSRIYFSPCTDHYISSSSVTTSAHKDH